jgi:hypothetical protein
VRVTVPDAVTVLDTEDDAVCDGETVGDTEMLEEGLRDALTVAVVDAVTVPVADSAGEPVAVTVRDPVRVRVRSGVPLAVEAGVMLGLQLALRDTLRVGVREVDAVPLLAPVMLRDGVREAVAVVEPERLAEAEGEGDGVVVEDGETDRELLRVSDGVKEGVRAAVAVPVGMPLELTEADRLALRVDVRLAERLLVGEPVGATVSDAALVLVWEGLAIAVAVVLGEALPLGVGYSVREAMADGVLVKDVVGVRLADRVALFVWPLVGVRVTVGETVAGIDLDGLCEIETVALLVTVVDAVRVALRVGVTVRVARLLCVMDGVTAVE